MFNYNRVTITVRLTNQYFWSEEENYNRLHELLEMHNGGFIDGFEEVQFNVLEEDVDIIEEMLYDNGDIFDYEHLQIENIGE